MKPWIKLYTDLLNNAKVMALDGETFKGWITVMLAAADTDGQIVDVNKLAFRLRLDPDYTHDLLTDLAAAGLLDHGRDGYTVHDWDEWQSTPAGQQGGSYAAHVRWHVKAGRVDPDCHHCRADQKDKSR